MLLGATRSSYRTFPQVHPPWTIVFFRLTRIRRKNPAFNYRFFQPGPLAFESEAGKNAGHDVTLSVQAARNNRKTARASARREIERREVIDETELVPPFMLLALWLQDHVSVLAPFMIGTQG
jgi:hypothetical protein